MINNSEIGILHDGKKILVTRSLQRNIRPTSDNTSYNHKTSSDMSFLYPQYIRNLAFQNNSQRHTDKSFIFVLNTRVLCMYSLNTWANRIKFDLEGEYNFVNSMGSCSVLA